MIPKVIHYCWFGGGEKDELTKKCIDSWKRLCPDYEIIEWNESNYDVTKNQYMYEAFQKRRWGFVSDYARLDIVFEHGGIYLDTDVEVIKPFDDLLSNYSFFGFEDSDSGLKVNTGSGFGAIPSNKLVETLRESYYLLSFIKADGSLNLTPCPSINSPLFWKYGFKPINEYQEIDGNVVYPYEYFSPFNWESGKGKITDNTYSIHHYNASWLSPEEKKRRRRARRLDYMKHIPNSIARNILGEKRYLSIKDKIRSGT